MPPAAEPPRSTAGGPMLVPAGEPAAGDAHPSIRAATGEAVQAAEETAAHESPGQPSVTRPAPRRHGAHPHDRLHQASHDRWKWRAAIRRSPAKRRIYRAVVAFVGLLLIALGVVSGPIPGPGGIPLVLLGLAVWASEFVWAQRLMRWFKRQLRRFQSWTRPQQTLAWLAFFAVCALFGYSYLLIIGPPGWLPASVDALLSRLPGV